MDRGNGVKIGWLNARRALLAVLLAVLAAPAWALGLGQIQVRSQAGEPLLAEIPIISSDPAELEGLQARLASADTFARIGLEPPQGVVSGLKFSIALDSRGRPVVRVTSPVAVQQSELTFLVEVEWTGGTLVREYSALVDVPRTVFTPAQPGIEAPAQAPANAIVREPAAVAPVAPVAPADQPAQPTPDEPREPSSTVADTAIPAPPVAPAPEAAVLASPAAPAAAANPGDAIEVKAGDTLAAIAAGVGEPGASLDQTMIALLRANPDAFIKGNINLIRRGATLNVPDAAAQAQYGAAEARALVREQIGQWRSMSAPPPQPVAVTGDNAAADVAKAAATAGTATASTDARLEIIPPSASGGRKAGTQSGIDAGGEGDMLRQELQQTKETLAARDSEVQELKARVADLEKMQQDQQKLISMKDSALAASQQNLATRQAVATTAATPDAQSPKPLQAPTLWPWIVLALLVATALAWLFARRRTTAAPRRPVFDAATLAPSVPAERRRADDIVDGEFTEPGSVPASTSTSSETTSTVSEEAPLDDTAARVDNVSHGSSPTWHSGATVRRDGPTLSELSAAAQPPAESPSRVESTADAGYTATTLNASPGGSERIELARAYVDLGDTDTARSLLQEVVDGGDDAARDEAARLLRELA